MIFIIIAYYFKVINIYDTDEYYNFSILEVNIYFRVFLFKTDFFDLYIKFPN